jgi:hypothetical protein
LKTFAGKKKPSFSRAFPNQKESNKLVLFTCEFDFQHFGSSVVTNRFDAMDRFVGLSKKTGFV